MVVFIVTSELVMIFIRFILAAGSLREPVRLANY
jgi:hypothetical protein